MSAGEAVLRALEGELGASGLHRDPAGRRRYALAGRIPEAVALPESPEQVAALLARAGEAGLAVVPWGAGGRAALAGAPGRYDLALSLARMDALLDHDVENLTLTAQAGATLFDASRRLHPERQILAAGWPWERRTLGGLVASNRGVPKRLAYGGLRDQLLGVRLALGDGRLVRFGGKVLKNVAGYDMTKLLIGSQGTAAVIVETIWKLFALPDEEIYWAGVLPSLQSAAELAARLLRAPLLPACLFLLDPPAAARFSVQEGLNLPPGKALAWVGFDGRAPALRREIADTEALAAAEGGRSAGTRERLSEAASGGLMGELAPDAETVQLRIGAAPARLGFWHAHLAAGLAPLGHSAEAVLDYPAGRMTWRFVAPEASWDAIAAWVLGVRAGLARERGFALLEQGPPALRERIGVWGDLGGAGRLMALIQSQLDPKGVLAPGRFAS